MKRIAFDIDDTLWKIEKYRQCPEHCVLRHIHEQWHQVPDYDLIQVLRWFHKNGDEVYVWSAGGVDYARDIVWKLGLDKMVTVIEKGKARGLDIAFDDEDTKLAVVDIKVNRPNRLD